MLERSFLLSSAHSNTNRQFFLNWWFNLEKPWVGLHLLFTLGLSLAACNLLTKKSYLILTLTSLMMWKHDLIAKFWIKFKSRFFYWLSERFEKYSYSRIESQTLKIFCSGLHFDFVSGSNSISSTYHIKEVTGQRCYGYSGQADKVDRLRFIGDQTQLQQVPHQHCFSIFFFVFVFFFYSACQKMSGLWSIWKWCLSLFLPSKEKTNILFLFSFLKFVLQTNKRMLNCDQCKKTYN